MRLTNLAAVGVLAACAGAVAAQGVVTYHWLVNDSGGDYLYSGESVLNFKLYALMSPEATGFAGSQFEILGGHEFATAGVITNYENKLGSLTDDGELQGNNDILDIEAFQLPPLFNPNFVADNPILVYEFDYQVTDFFTILSVRSANHVSSDVYTDTFGTNVPYDTVPGSVRVIIPAPASAVPMLGLLGLCRRRR